MALIRPGRSRETGEAEAPVAPPTERPAPRGADSLLAQGMRIDGDCETTGALRIEGHVGGNVKAQQLRVTSTGRVDGDVAGGTRGGTEEVVVIEGEVRGTVHAPRVEVGQGGAVGAGLRVQEAIVRGRVKGPVVAERRLVLEETAVVEGDVTAARLAVKEGGQVAGVIRIGAEAVGGGRSAGSAGSAGAASAAGRAGGATPAA